jgi:hypothetical protein
MQPRNYFTDAADWFLERNSEPRILPAAEYLTVKSKVEHWVKNGICFALPPSGILLDPAEGAALVDHGLLRLPYPVCILEYTTADKEGHLKIIIIAEMVGDQVQVDMISAASGGGVWTPPAIKCDAVVGRHTYQVAPRLPRYIQNKEADWAKGRNFREDAKLMLESLALRPLYEFLYAIDRYHTTMDNIAPPDGVNRKRLKRGKVPLFTYKVLTIGKKKRKSQHLGGTHASPRSHLRRGYYRTSQKGVRHWVQPCMVKGETDGFVHKDYRVEGAIECES